MTALTGLTEQTIKRWTLEPRQDYFNRVSNRHGRIWQLRADGKAMREISAELGIRVGTVHYALTKNEIS